jgi:hypothetical protein
MAFNKADTGRRQQRVETGNSIDLRCVPPILARANNPNIPSRLDIKKIAIDAD